MALISGLGAIAQHLEIATVSSIKEGYCGKKTKNICRYILVAQYRGAFDQGVSRSQLPGGGAMLPRPVPI